MNAALSVVVRARNAESDLRELFARLASQSLPPGVSLQTVVVDNDSRDGTRALVQDWGGHLVPIAQDEFSWGRALNKGIEAARGELVVLLSADAWPIGDDWLMRICAPFVDERVAVVYGKQVPRSTAPLDEWVRVRWRFPEKSRHWTEQDVKGGRVLGIIASNACAVLRRSAWERFPYDEASLGAEERPWTAQVLRAGYHAMYLAEASVEHSHRESAIQQALRIWELELEARRVGDRDLGPMDGIRAVVAFVRQRVRNVFVPEAGASRRLEALLCLPWEVAALGGIAAAGLAGADWKAIRQRWWRPGKRKA